MADTANPDKMEETRTDSGRFTFRRKPGDTLFALITLAGGVFLLSQIGSQTKWVSGVSILLQPRFWPGICLGGFLLFGIAYVVQSLRNIGCDKSVTLNDRIWQPQELFNWSRTLEYVAYFLIYVFLVPRIGYLLATVLFCVLITLRAGYKQNNLVMWAAFGGFIIVLVFRTLLRIKMPPGKLYGLFPDAIRNFLGLYF